MKKRYQIERQRAVQQFRRIATENNPNVQMVLPLAEIAGIIAKIRKVDPAPIRSLRPMAPVALDRVVRSCLMKDPENRFQSTQDAKLGWNGFATRPSSPRPNPHISVRSATVIAGDNQQVGSRAQRTLRLKNQIRPMALPTN